MVEYIIDIILVSGLQMQKHIYMFYFLHIL